MNNERKGWKILAIVLSAIIIAACGWYICRHLLKNREAKQIITTFGVAANTDTDKKIMMIDGTQIWIRNGGHVSYLSTFTADRTVNLLGDAFFIVSNTTQIPFRIATGGLVVEANEAEFQVIASEDGQQAQVIVNSGTVRVSAMGGTPHNLAQGEQLTLNDDSISVESLPKGSLNEWRSEKLNFRLMTLPEIFDSLSELYNIPFEFDRAQLGGDRFTIKLNGTEQLTEVLAIASAISGQINYTIDPGVKVIIFSK